MPKLDTNIRCDKPSVSTRPIIDGPKIEKHTNRPTETAPNTKCKEELVREREKLEIE